MRLGPVDLPSAARAVRYDSRETWLEARREGIGASDVAKVLGVSPYGGPWSVYASKRWGVSTSPTAHLEAGLREEPRILEDLRRETGWDTIGPLGELSITSKVTPFRVTLDGFAHDGESWGVVECKVDQSGFRWGKSRRVLREWSRDSKEWFRQDYYVQLATQLLATGLDWGCLAVRTQVGQLRIYRVYRDEAIEALIRRRALDFWRDLEAGKPPPEDDSEACARALARMYPAMSEHLRDATEEEVRLAKRIELLRETSKRCDQERRELGVRLASLIGEDYGVVWPSEGRKPHKALWQRSGGGGRRLDVEALRRARPDLVSVLERFTREPEKGRTIRVYLQNNEGGPRGT